MLPPFVVSLVPVSMITRDRSANSSVEFWKSLSRRQERRNRCSFSASHGNHLRRFSLRRTDSPPWQRKAQGFNPSNVSADDQGVDFPLASQMKDTPWPSQFESKT